MNNLPEGSDVSWAPWNEKPSEPEQKVKCPFCGFTFPESNLIEINLCGLKHDVCEECNDELHTCIKCGDKVIMGEDFYINKKHQYVHNYDCRK